MDEMMENFFDGGEFEYVEIDPDYEFDAARYFDFTRPESPAETYAAERWFKKAYTYSHSPYVARMILEEDLENWGMLDESEMEEEINSCVDHSESESDSSMIDERSGDCDKHEAGSCFSDHKDTQNLQQEVSSDIMDCSDSADVISHAGKDARTGKGKITSAIKAPFQRVSTLMKPTASQLAKQTQRRDIKSSSQLKQKFHEQSEHKKLKSVENSSANESHVIKKQKLEGGYPRKVLGPKQQMTFRHKISKKDVLICSDQPRLRLTIPREPELETSQRAHRIRSKHSTEVEEQILSATSSFKARPLNRKIRIAPSIPVPRKSTPQLPEFQEFHLKTTQRAMQHSSAAPSSVQKISDSDEVSHNKKTGSRTHMSAKNLKNSEQRSGYIPSQKSIVNEPRCERNEELHKFKALPLNKKILSSKGDMGVFRSNKRETTLTMEFNFQTEKRLQQNPPIELFKKLSLKSEPRPRDTAAESMLSRPPRTVLKGSKENIDSLQQKQKMPLVCKEKLHKSGSMQIQNGDVLDGKSPATIIRSSSIR